MIEAYLVGGARTPIGRYGGALASVRPDDLAAIVVAEAIRRAGIAPEIMGLGPLPATEKALTRSGLATMCVGVGQGTALIFEGV
jgi:acetyl-CoA acetyltransferase